MIILSPSSTCGIDPLPFAGAGITAQVAPRFQRDATMDIGLTDATTRVSFSGGMTVLIGEDEARAAQAPQ